MIFTNKWVEFSVHHTLIQFRRKLESSVRNVSQIPIAELQFGISYMLSVAESWSARGRPVFDFRSAHQVDLHVIRLVIAWVALVAVEPVT